ncbi:MAG: hypothetical protein Kow00127_19120 [Bacteroidales bacterium]
MDQKILNILKTIRIAARNGELTEFTFPEIESATGIKQETLNELFSAEEDLVKQLLNLEREKFEEIFLRYDFEGVNAIDILLTVSKEVAKNFLLVSPAITIHLKEKYPAIYQDHFDKRLKFIFEKIQINITKGINQGIYREDLSIELLARLYLSRLIDIHNPDLFPPEKFSFETLFAVMFEDLIRSIGKPQAISYFEQKIKSVNFDIDAEA